MRAAVLFWIPAKAAQWPIAGRFEGRRGCGFAAGREQSMSNNIPIVPSEE